MAVPLLAQRRFRPIYLINQLLNIKYIKTGAGGGLNRSPFLFNNYLKIHNMTTGEIIQALIKKKFKTQLKAATAANIPHQYISRIVQNKLKSGPHYDSLIKTLGVPYEIIVFKTFNPDLIQCPAQRSIVKQILPEMMDKIDLLFDLKIV